MYKKRENKANSVNRVTYLDIAKGFAILAVISGHCGLGKIGTFLYTFHLPLFFIISGYCFKFQNDFKVFIKSKVKNYLVPYFCCSIILAVYGFITHGLKSGEWIIIYLIDRLLSFIIQRRHTTLWFLAALFFGVLIFWLICKLFKNNLKNICIVSSILSFTFIIYDEVIGISLPWNIDTSFIILFYLAFGYLLKSKSILEHMISNKRRLPIYIVAAWVINISCSLANYLLCHKTYEMFVSSYGVFPLTIIAACAGSVGVIFISTYFVDIFLIKWLGENTMAFFAFHQSIGIPIMSRLCGYIFAKNEGFIMLITEKAIIFIGTMFICFFMHVILVKIHLGFVIGKTKSRKSLRESWNSFL